MRVFISRALFSDSLFRHLLESKGLVVDGVPMVLLAPLPFSEVPTCDWVFFSSKNAVKFFFQNTIAQPLPEKVRWAAIGPATAKELAKHCPIIDFIGTGDPQETALLFEAIAHSKTVLFPSARRSREGVQRFLSPQIHCLKLEIYDNQPVEHPLHREEDVLVFTSPMSAEAYFTHHTLLEKQGVIAIGKSTFSTLQSLGIERLHMSANTNEESMAEAVLLFLVNS